MGELSDRIRSARFTPRKAQGGYAVQEVDDFLERLAQAADRGEQLRALVDGARFTPVRLRAGYDMGEVDDFLDEVVAASTEGGLGGGTSAGATGAGPAEAWSTSGTPYPSVIQEKRGWLARLRNR